MIRGERAARRSGIPVFNLFEERFFFFFEEPAAAAGEPNGFFHECVHVCFQFRGSPVQIYLVMGWNLEKFGPLRQLMETHVNVYVKFEVVISADISMFDCLMS